MSPKIRCLAVLAQQAGRIAGIYAGLGNRLGYYRARADHHIVANTNRHDGSIGTDRNSITNAGFFPFARIAPRRAATRKAIVDEHDAVANETVFTDRHQFTYEAVTLYPCTCADDDTFLHFAKWSDEDPVAKRAFIQVGRFDNGYYIASLYLTYAGDVMFDVSHGTSAPEAGMT